MCGERLLVPVFSILCLYGARAFRFPVPSPVSSVVSRSSLTVLRADRPKAADVDLQIDEKTGDSLEGSDDGGRGRERASRLVEFEGVEEDQEIGDGLVEVESSQADLEAEFPPETILRCGFVPYFSRSSKAIPTDKEHLVLFLPGLFGATPSKVQRIPALDRLAARSVVYRFIPPDTARSTNGSTALSYLDLVNACVRFLQRAAVQRRKMRVTIVGESFGALLALGIALRWQTLSRASAVNELEGASGEEDEDVSVARLDGGSLESLVILNSASSYDDTFWGVLKPLVERLQGGAAYTLAAGAAYFATLPDDKQLRAYLSRLVLRREGKEGGQQKNSGGGNETETENFAGIRRLVDVQVERAARFFGGVFETWRRLEDSTSRMPPPELSWRLERWLSEGVSTVNSRLSDLKIPTLVVAGSEDRLLPSVEEAVRLVQAVGPSAQVLVEGSGHNVLDKRFSIDLLMEEAGLFEKAGGERGWMPRFLRNRVGGKEVVEVDLERERQKREREKVERWFKNFTAPQLDDLTEKDTREVEFLVNTTSPVFISSDAVTGRRTFGLDYVPSPAELAGRPVLLVGNHQLFGIDLGVIVLRFLKEKGVLVRGMGHPFIFLDRTEAEGGEGRGRGDFGDDDEMSSVWRKTFAVVNTSREIGEGTEPAGPKVFTTPEEAQEALGSLIASTSFVELLQGSEGEGGGSAVGAGGTRGGGRVVERERERDRAPARPFPFDAERNLAPFLSRVGRGRGEEAREKENGRGGGDGDSERKSELPESLQGIENRFERFGAVPVTPRNFVRLMQRGDWAMLFPGGVREVYHRKGEKDAVVWPQSPEFVRLAARYNATIIPFSAIGSSDSFSLLLDTEELLKVPILGDRLRENAMKLPKVREFAGAQGRAMEGGGSRMNSNGEIETEEDLDQMLVAPVGFPKPPDRFYFLFGRPLDCRQIDPNNREQCAAAYRDLRSTVETGIDELRNARERDPFRNVLARLVFSRAFPKAEGVPTFPLSRLYPQRPYDSIPLPLTDLEEENRWGEKNDRNAEGKDPNLVRGMQSTVTNSESVMAQSQPEENRSVQRQNGIGESATSQAPNSR